MRNFVISLATSAAVAIVGVKSSCRNDRGQFGGNSLGGRGGKSGREGSLLALRLEGLGRLCRLVWPDICRTRLCRAAGVCRAGL